jgi:hypothetical protein
VELYGQILHVMEPEESTFKVERQDGQNGHGMIK